METSGKLLFWRHGKPMGNKNYIYTAKCTKVKPWNIFNYEKMTFQSKEYLFKTKMEEKSLLPHENHKDTGIKETKLQKPIKHLFKSQI